MLITKQNYLDYSGIDLDIELRKGNSDNPTKAVAIFLARIENYCLDFLESNYMVTPESDNFDEDDFKKGVLYQIDYIRVNGDLTMYNPNELPVLSKVAYKAFKMGGMCNTAFHRNVTLDPWL